MRSIRYQHGACIVLRSRTHLAILFLLAFVMCMPTSQLVAQITVGLDSNHLRSGFKPTFFGINGQNRNNLPWANTTSGVLDNPGFASVGIQVTSGGSGYTSAPAVTISGNTGSGATATATISGGSVVAVNITSGGTGYKPAPQVTISGGGGSGASAAAIVSASGVVTAVEPINIGTGYTSAPTVTISGNPNGSGATATALLSGGSVTGYSISSGGTGYTSAPQVSLTGGGGSGATAAATVTSGAVGPALQQLQMGVLRFPAGTGGNYWDWNSGDFVNNYYYTPVPSRYTSPLSEWQAELKAASQPSGTATQGVFVLNMLADPTCTPAAPDPYCTLNTNSPNLTYQEQLLTSLANSYTKPAYLELGNEYYLQNNCYAAVYANGGIYGATANAWVTGIQSQPGYSSAKIAAVAAHIGGNSARATWDQDLMYGDGNGNGPLTGATAVTMHIYEGSGLSSGTTVSAANVHTMLYTPFKNWGPSSSSDCTVGATSILCEDIPSLKNTSTGYTPNIWITEYNLRDTNVAAFGTWAHGLFTATMSLLFLENSRIQMAIHHAVQGGSIYSDVIQSTSAFSPPGFAITTQSDLPNGVKSAAYSKSLGIQGGVSPYTWSVASGSLPPGITLGSNGTLSGTPTSSSGSPYNFTIQVTDSTMATASASFNLTIQSTGTPTMDCSGGGGVVNSTYPTNGANILTRVNGLTAQGLTTREIDTAALGQNTAQKLTFTGSGVPLFPDDGVTPELYGWIFSGGSSVPTETIILNLSSSTQTIDLSSVTGIAVGNSIRQLSASDPGTYVTGGLVASGYEGVDYNMPPGSTAQPVALATGSLGNTGSSFPISALPLPPFSLTRIY